MAILVAFLIKVVSLISLAYEVSVLTIISKFITQLKASIVGNIFCILDLKITLKEYDQSLLWFRCKSNERRLYSLISIHEMTSMLTIFSAMKSDSSSVKDQKQSPFSAEISEYSWKNEQMLIWDEFSSWWILSMNSKRRYTA